MSAFGIEALPISEEAARRELWVSFISLVRSYVAASQIGLESAQVLVLQADEHELEIVGRQRTIQVTLDPGRATGYWAMHRAPIASDNTLLTEGAFRIGMDSKIEWTGLPGPQEMDAVAEALATLSLAELDSGPQEQG